LYLNKQCAFNALYIDNLTLRDIEIVIEKKKPLEEELAKQELRVKKENQKYDYLLPDELLDKEYARTYLDIDSSWNVLKSLVKNKSYKYFNTY
jgi:hypothetical protein